MDDLYIFFENHPSCRSSTASTCGGKSRRYHPFYVTPYLVAIPYRVSNSLTPRLRDWLVFLVTIMLFVQCNVMVLYFLRWVHILDDIIVYRRWPRSHSNYIRLWFDIVPSCKRAFSSNSIQACGSSWILPEWLTLYLLSRGESIFSKI